MQLHRERGAIEAAGAKLIVVGNGAPSFIEGFRERSGYDGPVYTDPDLVVYRALGYRRDLRGTMSLRTIGRGIAAFGKGHRQIEVQGDPLQLGGALVVARDGTVVFRQRSAHAGDHADTADLIDAARRAAALSRPGSSLPPAA